MDFMYVNAVKYPFNISLGGNGFENFKLRQAYTNTIKTELQKLRVMLG